MIEKETMLLLYGYDDYSRMCVDCYENGENYPSLNDVADKCKKHAENLDSLNYYCINSYTTRCHSPVRQIGVAEVMNKKFQEDEESKAVIKAFEWVLKQEQARKMQ